MEHPEHRFDGLQTAVHLIAGVCTQSSPSIPWRKRAKLFEDSLRCRHCLKVGSNVGQLLGALFRLVFGYEVE